MSPTSGDSQLGRAGARVLSALSVALLVVAVGWALREGIRRPVHNFDLIDYMALALEYVEPDPEVVHRRAYETAQAELPPEVYATISASSDFRREIRADWRLFDANLGFHRGRYLYSLAVLVAHELGARLTAATWYANQFFWCATALLVFVWARRHLALGLAALLTLALLYSPPVLSLLPASSPESMAMFFVALGLYLWVERKAFAPGALALTLSILVRPEFVLVCVGVAAGLFLLAREGQGPSRRFLGLWGGISLVLWFAIAQSAHDPGWWPVVTSPIKRVSHLDQVMPFKLEYYLALIERKLEPLTYVGYDIAEDGSFVRGSGFLIVYLALAGLLAGLALRARLPEFRPHAAIALGLIAATLARLALFPYPWDRYFVYLWVPVPLLLAGMGAALVARAAGERDANVG
ncbi:MAG: hypothetical protein EXS08_11770 [Planctomycetes bacterium]|nr:hypothetical protein [Planctomycetota bacterium]